MDGTAGVDDVDKETAKCRPEQLHNSYPVKRRRFFANMLEELTLAIETVRCPFASTSEVKRDDAKNTVVVTTDALNKTQSGADNAQVKQQKLTNTQEKTAEAPTNKVDRLRKEKIEEVGA